MSNNSPIAEIELSLAAARSRDVTPQLLADVIRNNGRALEGMQYPLIKEFEILAMDLDTASWQEDDEFPSDLPSVLSRVDSWLRLLPRDEA